LFTLVMLGVTWGSLTPNAPSLRVTNIDKAQHLGAYALLAALAYAACRGRSWRVALALIGFGVAIEFAQAALADGRDGSALDGLANGAGVLLVSLGWRRRALR
jgi:VanZ family protein